MKFAEIGYLKEGESLWVSDFVMRLPKRIRDKYFLCFVPLKIEPAFVGDAEGIKITLPITSLEQNMTLYTRMIKKTVSLLMSKEIQIVINEDRIPLPADFIQARGSIAVSYFVSRIFKDACVRHNIKPEDAKVVVTDGKNLETFLVLNSLIGEVNHLSVRTDNKAALEDLADTIFEESGLVTEFFVSPKSSYIKNADVIINCSSDMENFDYVFKKGLIYIEASPFKGKLNRLISRRDDIYFFTNLYTEVCGVNLDAAHMEVLFLIKCAQSKKGMISGCADYKDWEILQNLRNFSLDTMSLKVDNDMVSRL